MWAREGKWGRVAPLWGCCVLVVEDEATIAIDITMALEEQGATIIGPVSAVADALRCIEETRIDCALLDIRLGDEIVWPVADALERDCAGIFPISTRTRTKTLTPPISHTSSTTSRNR